MKTKTPKRHHYLPQFYLHNFCRAGKLWIFDRDRKSLNEQTPLNTGVIGYYNAFIDESGNRNIKAEEVFSHNEGKAKVIIDKLGNREDISALERSELSVFIALLMNRGPVFENSVNNVQAHILRKTANMMFKNDGERVKRVIAEAKKEFGESFNLTESDLLDFANEDIYEFKINRVFSLWLLLSLSNELSRIIFSLNWYIVRAPKNKSYITSDNPYMLLPPDNYVDNFYGYGIATVGAKSIIPLTQEICLHIEGDGGDLKYVEVTNEHVRNYNLNAAINAYQFIIGRDKELVESVARKVRFADKKKRDRFNIR